MKDKDAYYFPHDSNARNDYKILRLRAKFGWEGYGVYFATIEVLREQTNFKLGKDSVEALATALGMDFINIQVIVNLLVELELLKREDGGGLYSESLITRLQHYKDQKEFYREMGRKGAKAKREKKLNPLKPPVSSKVNKIKENKTKIDNNYFEDVFLLYLPEFVNKLSLETWKEWIDYKRGTKKKITKLTAEKQLKFLLKQADPVECINQTIRNGWIGLFEVKDATNKQIGASPDELARIATDYAIKQK